MPWKESSVMDERMQFVARRLAGEGHIQLCERHSYFVAVWGSIFSMTMAFEPPRR